MAEIYRLDFVNGKAYIGVSVNSAAVRYHSHARTAARKGKLPVHRAWRSVGTPKLTVLAIVERADAYETERRAISVFRTLVPDGYNLALGGNAPPTTSPLVAAKVSRALKGRPRPNWVRIKIGNGNRGKVRTQETIAVLVASHSRPETRALLSALNSGHNNPRFGISPTSETRRKMSNAHKGKRNSAEHNGNISRSLMGRVISQEWRDRIAAAHKGKRLSVEHRANLSQSQKRAWLIRSRSVPEHVRQSISKSLRDAWRQGKFIGRKQ